MRPIPVLETVVYRPCGSSDNGLNFLWPNWRPTSVLYTPIRPGARINPETYIVIKQTRFFFLLENVKSVYDDNTFSNKQTMWDVKRFHVERTSNECVVNCIYLNNFKTTNRNSLLFNEYIRKWSDITITAAKRAIYIYIFFWQQFYIYIIYYIYDSPNFMCNKKNSSVVNISNYIQVQTVNSGTEHTASTYYLYIYIYNYDIYLNRCNFYCFTTINNAQVISSTRPVF